ncbi:hypothetical protein PSYJA_46611, partial [Pseudomonas syringae pv. japonica str. M301072]
LTELQAVKRGPKTLTVAIGRADRDGKATLEPYLS